MKVWEIVPGSLPAWSMWEGVSTQHTVSLRENPLVMVSANRPQCRLLTGHATRVVGFTPVSPLCPKMSCVRISLISISKKSNVTHSLFSGTCAEWDQRHSVRPCMWNRTWLEGPERQTCLLASYSVIAGGGGRTVGEHHSALSFLHFRSSCKYRFQ